MPLQKVVIGGALAAIVLLAAYWTLLFVAQRSMLFPMPPVAGAPPRPPFAEQIWLNTSFGRVEAWHLPAIEPVYERAPLLLFAHGNGELIDYWPEEFEAETLGADVLLVEYPGYGRSAEAPSQVSITEAMLTAYEWARQHPRVDASRIIPYGRSLGGGAAAAIVSTERPVPALILESSFSSVAAFAAGFGAPRLLVRDPFDSVSAVKSFTGPILILHGDRDDIVPPHHARALAAAAGNATLTFMACGHNDCPRPWMEVRAFLSKNGLLPHR